MSRFLIESIPEKCKACRRCEVACIAAHNGLTFKEAMKKRNELVARVHVVKSGSVKDAISCQQCEDAPCARICPTGALRQENGVVVSREQLCSGCKLCIMACPYGAIALGPITMPDDASDDTPHVRKNVALRCDLCMEWRQKEGKSVPACVEACTAKARRLVEKPLRGSLPA